MTVTRVTAPDGRTVVYPGTQQQAEAYVALQAMHDTDPDYETTLAVVRGDKEEK